MKQNNDYLYLIWKDPQTRKNFTVGKLTRGVTFTFQYIAEASEAETFGWKKLDAFPDDQVYENDTIFPVFSSRLPDRKRRDLDKILQKYGLEEFDEFELLKKSGARLPIDTYEFIDPIRPEDESVQRDFYVMGTRHSTPCNGECCDLLPAVTVGDRLTLQKEPDNLHDPFAIRVMTQNGDLLGYVPRYYNKEIGARIESGMSYCCKTLEVNIGYNCSECIKVHLNMPDSNE